MSEKLRHEKAIKKSISLPEFLYIEGTQQQRENRLTTFSDYIQELIRRDTMRLHSQPPAH